MRSAPASSSSRSWPAWRRRLDRGDVGAFSQLRFTNQIERVWGLKIKRFRPSLNEEVYWVVVGRTERAWASRFGDLRGILDVSPRQRLEILPYGAASSRLSGTSDPGNPGSRSARSAR